MVQWSSKEYFDCSKNRSSVDIVGLQLNFKVKLAARKPDTQFC